MPTELTWIASAQASGWNAALQLARGRPLADQQLAAALGERVAVASELVSAAGVAPVTLFEQLVPLSVGTHSRRELLRLAARKTLGGDWPEAVLPSIDAELAQIENIVRTSRADLLSELELRGGPIREQWEARGGGMLHEIGRQTDASVVSERATVALVHPVLGGWGESFIAYNLVSLEAVLTNTEQSLPEVARLAWLIATLELDTARHSDGISRLRLRRLAPLAMLPAALEGAVAVELVSDAAASLPLAAERWMFPPASPQEQEALSLWWTTFTSNPTPWSVALRALDSLVGAALVGCDEA